MITPKAGTSPSWSSTELQLHLALGAPRFRSIMQRGMWIDDGGIQADQFLLESEFACAPDLSRGKLIEPAGHLPEELSRPVSIGMGQGRTSGGSLAQMDQFPSPIFSPPSISRKAWDYNVRAGLFIGDPEHRELEGSIRSA